MSHQQNDDLDDYCHTFSPSFRSYCGLGDPPPRKIQVVQMSHGPTGLGSPKAQSLLKGCILLLCMECGSG